MENNYGEIAAGIGSIIGILFLYLLYFTLIAFYIFCMWKIFVKAGKPGWAAIVPVYNILIELEITRLPWWFLLLMFVPLANFVILIFVMLALAKVFGKSTAFGIGLLFLSFIFIPMLAFGKDKYDSSAEGILGNIK
ncbi:MAG: DUF5684 domain-containing protein [Candidatus Humimicrobiaceae bacterium]